MNKTPKISVIVPVYNVENYLCRCVDSIINQTFTDFEVLLIDDGSPDRSGEICDEYAQKDSRVKAFHKKNGGVSSARNLGISKANGKYIVFVDPDDLILPNTLGVLVLRSEESCADIVYGRAYKFSTSDYSDLKEIFPYPLSDLQNIHNGIDLYTQNVGIRGAVWGNVFKADFLRKNKLFFIESIANGEDSFFMANCYICNPVVLFLDIDYYLFYQREGSATHSWNENRLIACVNNLSYFINEINDTKEDIYKYMLNLQIYTTVSSIFCNLNYCFSNKLRIKLCRKIKMILNGHKVILGPINRDCFKIYVLNISINMFSILSRAVYYFR